jgi:hypothetical protein
MFRLGVPLALLFFITVCVWVVDVLLQIGWIHWIPEGVFCYLLGTRLSKLVPSNSDIDVLLFAISLWLFAMAWLLIAFGPFILLPSAGFFGLFYLGYRRATAH